MKRICLFAHYDRDNQIDDYVLQYLKALQAVTDKIIFSSDSNLPKKEADKLKGLAILAHGKHHGEYDFGSWKRCLQKVEKELDLYDELVLANDSCFAPFHPFKSVFQTMGKKDLDVWGLSKGRSHYQTYLDSYFLVLKENVFKAKWFNDFMKSVKRQKDVFGVARLYEIGFSKLLRQRGLKFDSYAPLRLCDFMGTDTFHQGAIDRINKLKMPTLKTKVLKQNIGGISDLKEKMNHLNSVYPKVLCQNYIKRICGESEPRHYFVPVSSFKLAVLHKKFIYIVAKTTKSYKWYRVMIKILGLPVFILPIWIRFKKKGKC